MVLDVLGKDIGLPTVRGFEAGLPGSGVLDGFWHHAAYTVLLDQRYLSVLQPVRCPQVHCFKG